MSGKNQGIFLKELKLSLLRKVKKCVIANEVKQSQLIKYQWYEIASCLAMTKNHFSEWTQNYKR